MKKDLLLPSLAPTSCHCDLRWGVVFEDYWQIDETVIGADSYARCTANPLLSCNFDFVRQGSSISRGNGDGDCFRPNFIVSENDRWPGEYATG
jgi:hypothetical protein